MSQAKVERYKQEKANRRKIMAQEKAKQTAAKICGWVVVAAILAWAGASAYTIYDNNRPVQTYQCDVTAIEAYMSELSVD